MKQAKLLALAAVAGLTACTENLSDSSVQGNALEFQPTIVTATDWNGTRALPAPETVRLTPDDTKLLYLHVTTEPCVLSETTRATLLNWEEMPEGEAFGVSGYRYTSASPLASTTPNFFYNARVAHNGSKWTADKSFYIPTGSERLAFFAYWPYDATAASISGPTATGPLTLSYTVNTSDPETQQELLTAAATDLDYDDSPSYRVPLRFQHVLTAVRFELGEDVAPGYVKQVGVLQVGVRGTHTVGGSWTVMETGDVVADFTADGSDGFDTSSLTEDTELLSGTKTLLMIPQTFAADNNQACIFFVLNDGTKTHTLYHYLRGTSWQAGTQVTYHISTSSINVVRADVDYPANWGGTPFTLKTAYTAETDTVGIFAVDAAGKVVVENAYYIYNGTTWQQKTGADTLFYKSDYEYFAYYPYRKTLAGAPVKGASVGRSLTADAFFANVISGWTITADQSTTKKLTANDLQVSKGVKVGDSKFAYRFPMQHQMGLAVLTLNAREVAMTRFFLHNNSSVYYDTTEKISYPVSDDFAGTNIPCPTADAQTFYYVARKGDSPVFSSSSTGADRWSGDVQIDITDWGTSATGTATAADDIQRDYYYTGWYWDTSGSYSDFTVQASKTYKLEVWGAQGGDAFQTFVGGRGGYAYGNITPTASSSLYVCVGGKGPTISALNSSGDGGYNGGGPSFIGNVTGNVYACGGGGATHVAMGTTNRGVLSNYQNYTSEVLIVAGGGGGGNYSHYNNNNWYHSSGGYGGGLNGGTAYSGAASANNFVATTGGAQSTYTAVGGEKNYSSNAVAGTFGKGGIYKISSATNYLSSGGGGGWYGGAGARNWSGGGGSSYIGGVQEPKATIDGGVTNGIPVAGAGGKETGHSGGGYARITLLEF